MAVAGAGKKLAWSNYTEVAQGKPGPTPNSVISAGTAVGIDADWGKDYTTAGGKNTVKLVDIKVSITLGELWVVKGTKSDALLAHEQGHYRIEELAAKELEAKLKAISVTMDSLNDASTEAQKQGDDAFAAMSKLGDELQDLYDSAPPKGTNHGLDATAQTSWTLKMTAAASATALKAAV